MKPLNKMSEKLGLWYLPPVPAFARQKEKENSEFQASCVTWFSCFTKTTTTKKSHRNKCTFSFIKDKLTLCDGKDTMLVKLLSCIFISAAFIETLGIVFSYKL